MEASMSDFTQIINECLAVSGEDFPADPKDQTAWHFTDKDIRGLLARVAERVEETMLDPAKVGEVVAKLAIERDQAMARAGTLEQERDEARQAARDYRRGVTRFLSTGFRLPEYVGVDDGELVAKHPWLKERP
jgi:hypothetical protein